MGKLAPPKDLRRHCRIPYDTPLDIDVSWTANVETKSTKAKLLEISVGGFRIEVVEPIPTKTLVTFRADAIDVSGTAIVRHAIQEGTKFILGLELTPETRKVMIGFSL